MHGVEEHGKFACDKGGGVTSGEEGLGEVDGVGEKVIRVSAGRHRQLTKKRVK